MNSDVGPVFIYGCGSVGTALAVRLASVGVALTGAHCRSGESAARAAAATGLEVTSGGASTRAMREADVVIVAVPDPSISAVAKGLAQGGDLTADQVVFHCSGARNADELDALRLHVRGVGSLHPLLSFADPELAARLLPAAAFAVEGDDEAVEAAVGLVGVLGGRVLRVDAADRVLYHAAAATASNHLVALVAQAVACLGALGIDRREATLALIPLIQSTLDNLARLGLPRALTGPVSRGDHECVSGHLEAIGARAPDEQHPYAVMAWRALTVAREQAAATPEMLAEVEAVLANALDEIEVSRHSKALDSGGFIK